MDLFLTELYQINLSKEILYHTDLKIQRVRKYIVVINNITCIKHYIMSRFPKLRFVKELQWVCKFNEKRIIN